MIMMSLLCDWEKEFFSRARALLPQRGEKRQKKPDAPGNLDPEAKVSAQTVTHDRANIEKFILYPRSPKK